MRLIVSNAALVFINDGATSTAIRRYKRRSEVVGPDWPGCPKLFYPWTALRKKDAIPRDKAQNRTDLMGKPYAALPTWKSLAIGDSIALQSGGVEKFHQEFSRIVITPYMVWRAKTLRFSGIVIKASRQMRQLFEKASLLLMEY